MSALWDPVAKMLEAVWTGGATPEEAVKTAQEAAEANIAAMK
jgi:maltose-binding protein MalE